MKKDVFLGKADVHVFCVAYDCTCDTLVRVIKYYSTWNMLCMGIVALMNLPALLIDACRSICACDVLC